MVNQDKLSSFYRGKKVFLTGHTGFKGSWLMAMLHQLGAVIKGYSLEPEYENGLFQIIWNKHLSENIIADIRDKERLNEEINSFQPDLIFHLAAQPLVRRSYSIPAETFEVNVVGTANLLEALITLKNKCTVVIVTTDKVYQNREQDILYTEDDMLGGYDPYSTSKACAELVVDSFRNSFFNTKNFDQHKKTIASARAGNVIGGGDWNKDRLLPDIVRALQNETEIEIRNPNSVRPWQHALEPLNGYLLLGMLLDNCVEYSGAYNFGPLAEDHLTVKELVNLSIEQWNGGTWKDISDPSSLHEARLLKLGIKKAKEKLNWQPKLTAKQSIEWTIKWYKQPDDQKKNFTYRQVQDYFTL